MVRRCLMGNLSRVGGYTEAFSIKSFEEAYFRIVTLINGGDNGPRLTEPTLEAKAKFVAKRRSGWKDLRCKRRCNSTLPPRSAHSASASAIVRLCAVQLW